MVIASRAAVTWSPSHTGRRIGKKKAAVAVGHSILVIAWHLLTDNCAYADPGGDYFVRRDTDRQRQRAVAQLQALGYRVALEPLAAKHPGIHVSGCVLIALQARAPATTRPPLTRRAPKVGVMVEHGRSA